MKYESVIKNGLVILPTGEEKVDVAFQDGKIAAIGLDLEGEEIIDAEGLIVSPGMVDAHVHITEPGGGYRDEWEGYETGTAAAAKGGVTAFMEMPLNQVPATTNGETLAKKFEAGEGKLQADVFSFGGLVPYNIDNNGIQELDEGGVAGYKCFLATCGDRSIDGDFQNVDDYSLYEGMKQIAKTGKVLAIHAENAEVTDRLGEIAYENGQSTMEEYVDSRPVFTEVEAIQRAILFAKETGCRIHICHVGCKEGIDLVNKARNEWGVDVTCESCVHNFTFKKEELNALGAVAKCSPPIREEAQREGLWERAKAGKIDFAVSDHSPCTPDLKDKENVFEAWGGISGLQNDVDVFYDEAVQKRGMDLVTFSNMIAKNPAERYDMKQKGSIEVGKDADFVFIKPNAPYTLKAEDLEYRNKFSPYVGREIGAQVMKTILRGHETYSKEKGVAKERFGEFVKH